MIKLTSVVYGQRPIFVTVSSIEGIEPSVFGDKDISRVFTRHHVFEVMESTEQIQASLIHFKK
jgi:hypothetical protein